MTPLVQNYFSKYIYIYFKPTAVQLVCILLFYWSFCGYFGNQHFFLDFTLTEVLSLCNVRYDLTIPTFAVHLIPNNMFFSIFQFLDANLKLKSSPSPQIYPQQHPLRGLPALAYGSFAKRSRARGLFCGSRTNIVFT